MMSRSPKRGGRTSGEMRGSIQLYDKPGFVTFVTVPISGSIMMSPTGASFHQFIHGIMGKIYKLSGAVASLLKVRVGGKKPQRFSCITSDHLYKFNIIPEFRDQLSLKPGYEERAAVTSALGKEKLWSSTNLYHHLEVLQNLVPKRPNEESAHPWVDAFIFRTSAMVSSKKHMVLCLEQVVSQRALHPQTLSFTTHSGLIGYTAAIADNYWADGFFSDPTLVNLKLMMPCGFFIAEAKIGSFSLMEQLPQAIGEMYACAKHLEINTLRGVLTNGLSWIFVLIVLNSDDNGAKYRYSTPIEFQWSLGDMLPQIEKPWPDVLAGILLHWVSIKSTFLIMSTNTGIDREQLCRYWKQ
ncbi:hypothetical protein EDB92DRAFT_2095768 [Lactarius akahatsu]|uniref:Uncharacterized protein n=1 Tax=Lactarius akahatsu TaxID=416441 RepID=A0AAD4Q7Y1_9AGAM|nr:hypothetical protein EDB92DRAFT_2095768 [Lactarius akahatsu]